MSSRLAEALQAQGGLVAELSRTQTGRGSSEPGPPQKAAAGPRAAGHECEYELLLEMILEGSRLHYEAPRVVRGADPDASLLLGDQLYALGLSRLAAIGDLEAVGELADLISLLAQTQAGGTGELAPLLWDAAATAIGWGAGAGHEAAKTLVRAEDPRAPAALASDARRDLDDSLPPPFN